MKKHGLELYEEFKSTVMGATLSTTDGDVEHIRTLIELTPIARTKHKRRREIKDFDVELLAADDIDPSSFMSPP
jgi:hypothetical protein